LEVPDLKELGNFMAEKVTSGIYFIKGRTEKESLAVCGVSLSHLALIICWCLSFFLSKGARRF